VSERLARPVLSTRMSATDRHRIRHRRFAFGGAMLHTLHMTRSHQASPVELPSP